MELARETGVAPEVEAMSWEPSVEEGWPLSQMTGEAEHRESEGSSNRDVTGDANKSSFHEGRGGDSS